MRACVCLYISVKTITSSLFVIKYDPYLEFELRS